MDADAPRGLPHFDSPQLPQFITFRLFDSLPDKVIEARLDETSAAYRRCIQDALDAGAGGCWLARPEFAEIVCEALVHGHAEIYDLHAFVVMPNHAHVLATLRDGFRLCDVLRGWKSYSARRINMILGRRGAL